MELDWETARHLLQVAADTSARGAKATANFLEGDNPLGRLVKDALIAIAIAAFSAVVINRMIERRERQRREQEAKPIREFVLEAISAAHGAIREAIANFDVRDGKQLKTRIKRLGDQLSKERARAISSVLAGFGYFERDQKEAIAEYMAAIRWDQIASTAEALKWVEDTNQKFCRVMTACSRFSPNSWSNAEIMAMKADLARLDAHPAAPTGPPHAAPPAFRAVDRSSSDNGLAPRMADPGGKDRSAIAEPPQPA